MIIVFGYLDDLGSAQYFEVDVDVSRNHRHEAQVTDSPIEDGTPVTDHVVIRPTAVSYEFLVSDAPIRSQAAYPAQSDVTRGQQAYARLMEIFRAKRLLDLVTPFETYSNMLITGIDVPEDRGHSGGLYATLSLREIHLAQSQAVMVQAQKTKALKKTLTGAPKLKATLTAVVEGKQKMDKWLLDKVDAIEKEAARAEEVAAASSPVELQNLSNQFVFEDLREAVQ